MTRCIPNTLKGEGNVEMVSGAIESSGKVKIKYGYIESRLRTTAHTGNFPAFWMMPQDNSAGWPNAGEIDIFEQIDNEDRSYHTIHSHWANGSADGGLGNSSRPQKSANSATTTGDYHVYAINWSEKVIKWFVNGKQVFSYAKSTNQADLDKLQWPFDKPFYLILNQSVGNGSWAKPCDPTFTYETVFDYVRVYQTDGQSISVPTGIAEAETSSLDFYVRQGKVLLVAPDEQHVSIYDLQGRAVFSEMVQGNRTVYLPKGVYVLNGKKIMVP